MFVLVTGGRDYNDIAAVFDAITLLDSQLSIDYIVHGSADGADTLADTVAKEVGINRIGMPANWVKFPKAAGPIRNKAMITVLNIDLVLAFPGGNGTANMKKLAKAEGIPVIESTELLNGS